MCRSESGLTLLEVVFSVAILGIVFLSFINLFGSTFGASVQAGRISQAAALAQEKMEMLRVNTYDELLQMGTELSGGVLPCPTAAVSSTPEQIDGFAGLERYYSIACHVFELDGYLVQGLRLNVVVQQGEGSVLARVSSFIPKDL